MILIKDEIDLRGFERNALLVMRDRAVGIMTEINNTILDNIKRRLNQAGSGRIYKSKTGGGKHQASAPGEPPAPDRGVYRDSWIGRVIIGNDFVQSLIGTPLWEVFGRRLEHGGSGGGAYIAPRPHVNPSIQDTAERVNELSRRLE